jgi:hypothetical protein
MIFLLNNNHNWRREISVVLHQVSALMSNSGGSSINFWASFPRIGEAGTRGPKMESDNKDKKKDRKTSVKQEDKEKKPKVMFRSLSLLQWKTSSSKEKTKIMLLPRAPQQVVLKANKEQKGRKKGSEVEYA